MHPVETEERAVGLRGGHEIVTRGARPQAPR
jgi:hypothetical protein